MCLRAAATLHRAVLCSLSVWSLACVVVGNGADTAADPGAPSSSTQPPIAPVSPFADGSSEEGPPKRKRGRPPGTPNKPKTTAKLAAATAAGTRSVATAQPKRRSRKSKQTAASVAAETSASKEAGAAAAAGPDREAEGEADAEAGEVGGEGAAAARLDMARKASTGDGSRLERPPADSNEGTLDSPAASGLEVQQHDVRANEHQLQRQASVQEEEQFGGLVQGEGGAEGELLLNGVRVFNPVAPVTKPPHRLSRVTGGLGVRNYYCVYFFMICGDIVS